MARCSDRAGECGRDCGDPDVLGAGILNQCLKSWKSVRVAATAPILVEKEKPVPRAELLQSERRAFLSLSTDPVGDCEFRGRLSCDALGRGYTRKILIAAGCTPSLQPHDRARGTSVIAVELAGKAMISITTCNTGLPGG